MLQRLYQLKVTLTDVEYDMREMDLCSVWGNYLWNAATVSKPVCVCTCPSACAHTEEWVCVWVCGMHVLVWEGVHICLTQLGVLVMRTACRNCCSRQEQKAEYEPLLSELGVFFHIRIVLPQHYHPNCDSITFIVIFVSNVTLTLIRKKPTWIMFFAEGFGHGSWSQFIVCSVSKMHVVDQVCWAVWGYCNIFSSLLVKKRNLFVYCKEKSHTSAADFS